MIRLIMYFYYYSQDLRLNLLTVFFLCGHVNTEEFTVYHKLSWYPLSMSLTFRAKNILKTFFITIILMVSISNCYSARIKHYNCRKVLKEIIDIIRSQPADKQPDLTKAIKGNERPILIVSDTWDGRAGGVLNVLKILEHEIQDRAIDVKVLHPDMIPHYKLRLQYFRI